MLHDLDSAQHKGEMKLQEPYFFLLIFNDSRIFSSFAYDTLWSRAAVTRKKHSAGVRERERAEEWRKNGNYA